MGLFDRKPKDGGGDGSPAPRRRDARSLLNAAVLLRVQAFVTAADGAVTLPKAEEGSTAGSSYARSLFNSTPTKPKLKVLAIRRGERDTTVSVGIVTRNGQTANEFTTKGVLTEANAMATGRDIAKLLKSPADGDMCGRELLALVQQPVGAQKAFSQGSGNRLMIESGTE